jgi:hypothetical protein
MEVEVSTPKVAIADGQDLMRGRSAGTLGKPVAAGHCKLIDAGQVLEVRP